MADDMHTEVWISLGDQDPDWAVESAPGRKHGGWSADLRAFYEVGEERIAEVLSAVPGVARVRALDWGSGTGRLSFALAKHFERVTCVDISPTMLKTLGLRAAERGVQNIDAVHLDDFRPEADHDLAVSLITLQHFPNRQAVRDALGAMVAALHTGGFLFVDLPSRPHNLRYRVQPRLQAYRILRRAGVPPARLHDMGLSGISMLCAPVDWVVSVLAELGMEVVSVGERRHSTHQQVHYVARRKGSPAAWS